MPWSVFAAAALAAATSQTVSTDQITDRVGVSLIQRLAESRSGAVIRIAPGLREQQVPMGQLEIEVAEPVGRFPHAHVAVPVRLRVDGRTVRTVTVWVEMSEPRTVWTYAHDTDRATSSESVVMVQKAVDTTCCAGPFLVSPDQVRGMRVRKAIRGGTPVQMSDFEAIPAVAMRQPVAVEVTRGSVELHLSGVAMSDGELGQRVAVRMPMATRLVDATVVGTNRVRVNE